jgi:hypothetical protein
MSEITTIVKQLHEGHLKLEDLSRKTKLQLYFAFVGYDSVEQYLKDHDPTFGTITKKLESNITRNTRSAVYSRRKDSLPIECVTLRRAKRVPRNKNTTTSDPNTIIQHRNRTNISALNY